TLSALTSFPTRRSSDLNCGGPRYASYINNIGDTLLRDLPKDEVLKVNNAWLGYGNEAPLDKLPTAIPEPGVVHFQHFVLGQVAQDRKSTRPNSSHVAIS